MAQQNKKRALLNEKRCNNPENTLNGCIDDIINVRNVLIDAYNYDVSNITMLRDDFYESLIYLTN